MKTIYGTNNIFTNRTSDSNIVLRSGKDEQLLFPNYYITSASIGSLNVGIINNINANNCTVAKLINTQSSIANAVITNAVITNSIITNGSINNLVSTSGTIASLNVGTIYDVNSTYTYLSIVNNYNNSNTIQNCVITNSTFGTLTTTYLPATNSTISTLIVNNTFTKSSLVSGQAKIILLNNNPNVSGYFQATTSTTILTAANCFNSSVLSGGFTYDTTYGRFQTTLAGRYKMCLQLQATVNNVVDLEFGLYDHTDDVIVKYNKLTSSISGFKKNLILKGYVNLVINHSYHFYIKLSSGTTDIYDDYACNRAFLYYIGI